jgi:phage baseplate assembly protein W
MIFKGISFPFRFSSTTGGVSVSISDDNGNNDLLRQSIVQIITTHLKERVIEKTFGCDFDLRTFDPMDTVLSQAVQYSIISAVTGFEPRVAVKKVDLIPDNENGNLTIQFFYSVKRTGQTDAFEFTV